MIPTTAVYLFFFIAGGAVGWVIARSFYLSIRLTDPVHRRCETGGNNR